MPIRRAVILFLFLLFCGVSQAQQAWWVFFTDKNGTTFDPYSYFAPEAIERRQQNHLSLYDSTDFPVNSFYLAEVEKRVDTLGQVTRWLNGVGVVATDKQVVELRKLPFVREVVPQQMMEWLPAMVPDTTIDDFDDKPRNVSGQISPMKGEQFNEHGHRGKGIIIAVLDAGFKGADTHPAFSEIRHDNRVRATFDFVKNGPDVYDVSADHGTMVLSCIAGIVNGTPMGLAPDATFLLARIAKEYGNQHRAEENFLAAVEWADKQGAMIINCSGGPSARSYFPEQVDGKTPIITRATNLAARKGMLVIAAAGNQGEAFDTNLLPPSDADSVLSVTAVNDFGYSASFSSRGPLPDFRRKPDVCAPGTAIVADGSGGFSISEGTSFSAPLLVGFAACLMEMYPDLQAMPLADTMRHCSSLYPYYDYAHGYGIPQASYFFEEKKPAVQSFTFERKDDTIVLHLSANGDCSQHDLLFCAFEDDERRIYYYEVFRVNNSNDITLPKDKMADGNRIHIFYKGYYARLVY